MVVACFHVFAACCPIACVCIVVVVALLLCSDCCCIDGALWCMYDSVCLFIVLFYLFFYDRSRFIVFVCILCFLVVVIVPVGVMIRCGVCCFISL